MKKFIVIFIFGLFLFPIQAQAKIRIICLGDSVTYGIYTNTSYPLELQALLGQDYEVMNIGIPGAKSGDLIKNLDEKLKLSNSDFFLIEIGHNDMDTDLWNMENFRKNLEIIGTYCKNHDLSAIFINLVQLQSEGEKLYGSDFKKMLNGYNNEIVRITNVYDCFMIPIKIDDSYFLDRVHLTADGNIELGKQIYKFLKNTMLLM